MHGRRLRPIPLKNGRVTPEVEARLRREKPWLFLCRVGCGIPVTIPGTYCEPHRREARRNANQRVNRQQPTKAAKRYLRSIQGDPCTYCGKPTQHLTYDHIVPAAKGGGHGIENLAPSCYSCNHRRGALPFLVFLQRSIAAQPDPLARRRRIGKHWRRIRELKGIAPEDWAPMTPTFTPRRVAARLKVLADAV